MVEWTYAHKLGHILLDHFHLDYGYLTSEFDCELLDAKAQIFAAEFLMQEDWMRRYTQLLLPSKAKNLGKLKELFKVSWDSLLNRLDNLKIQANAISLAILESNQNVQNKSRNNEFFDGLDDLYDEAGFAINDDRSYLISLEDVISGITDIGFRLDAKDLGFPWIAGAFAGHSALFQLITTLHLRCLNQLRVIGTSLLNLMPSKMKGMEFTTVMRKYSYG